MEDGQSGTPFLDPMPVQLHGSREYMCMLDNEALCEYTEEWWHFWYQADHVFAIPTVIFFCAGIGLFTLGFLVTRFAPRSVKRSPAYRRPIALLRYLSYRSIHVSALKWNSPPVGVMLLGLAGLVYFLAMTLGPKPYYWSDFSLGSSPPIATRAGWMSIACIPFIFVMGSKANLVTLVTGVSHEKLQVFHRWIAYACFVLALVHTFPFIVVNIQQGTMVMVWQTQLFYWTGVVALLAQAWLTFASFAPFRDMCYEFFKATHFVAGLVFFVFCFLHCDFTLTSWDYFIAAFSIYGACLLFSQVRTYVEHGFGYHAKSTLAANGFVRVSVPAKSGWAVSQHVFVRFLGLGPHAWTSHPFTICSLPARAGDKNNELVLYIRPQGGFTSQLARHVKQHGEVSMRVLLDGPYGGIDMHKFDTRDGYLVIAGGSGAGWTLPLVEAFLRRLELEDDSFGNDNERGSGRLSMKVIIATRDLETRCWYKETLAELLSAYPSAGERLQVEMHRTGGAAEEKGSHLHCTAPPSLTEDEDNEEKHPARRVGVSRASSDFTAASGDTKVAPDVTLQDFDSRPDLPAIVAGEAAAKTSLGIYLCGPHGMQSDVANAAAAAQLPLASDGRREVYLHMEHFAWA